MYSPASRVLATLEILQARGTVPAGELAERLEVETRTVRRYVTALRDLGIPVASTPGRGGGYRLGPGSKLPPLMLDDGEALAVVVSLLRALARGADGDLGTGAATALAKINRVLPRELRAGVAALQATAEFTWTGLPAPEPLPAGADEATVLTAATARYLRQRLALRYRSWRGEETRRRVDPYGLVQHLGSWYLAGWCHLREDIRVFRLDRVVEIEMERATFEPPGEFDAREHVIRSLALAPYRWEVEVVIEAPLDEVRPLVPDGLAAASAIPGGTLLEARLARLEIFARFLLYLGLPFRVIQPPELRGEVRRTALLMLACVDGET
jgi:predicted DNA-binding transcriptional regulator YafY